jgi:hypothetical protein
MQLQAHASESIQPAAFEDRISHRVHERIVENPGVGARSDGADRVARLEHPGVSDQGLAARLQRRWLRVGAPGIAPDNSLPYVHAQRKGENTVAASPVAASPVDRASPIVRRAAVGHPVAGRQTPAAAPPPADSGQISPVAHVQRRVTVITPATAPAPNETGAQANSAPATATYPAQENAAHSEGDTHATIQARAGNADSDTPSALGASPPKAPGAIRRSAMHSTVTWGAPIVQRRTTGPTAASTHQAAARSVAGASPASFESVPRHIPQSASGRSEASDSGKHAIAPTASAPAAASESAALQLARSGSGRSEIDGAGKHPIVGATPGAVAPPVAPVPPGAINTPPPQRERTTFVVAHPGPQSFRISTPHVLPGHRETTLTPAPVGVTISGDKGDTAAHSAQPTPEHMSTASPSAARLTVAAIHVPPIVQSITTSSAPDLRAKVDGSDLSTALRPAAPRSPSLRVEGERGAASVAAGSAPPLSHQASAAPDAAGLLPIVTARRRGDGVHRLASATLATTASSPGSGRVNAGITSTRVASDVPVAAPRSASLVAAKRSLPGASSATKSTENTEKTASLVAVKASLPGASSATKSTENTEKTASLVAVKASLPGASSATKSTENTEKSASLVAVKASLPGASSATKSTENTEKTASLVAVKASLPGASSATKNTENTEKSASLVAVKASLSGASSATKSTEKSASLVAVKASLPGGSVRRALTPNASPHGAIDNSSQSLSSAGGAARALATISEPVITIVQAMPPIAPPGGDMSSDLPLQLGYMAPASPGGSNFTTTAATAGDVGRLLFAPGVMAVSQAPRIQSAAAGTLAVQRQLSTRAPASEGVSASASPPATTVSTAATAPEAAQPPAQDAASGSIDLERVANAVYRIIRDRLLIERESKGL